MGNFISLNCLKLLSSGRQWSCPVPKVQSTGHQVEAECKIQCMPGWCFMKLALILNFTWIVCFPTSLGRSKVMYSISHFFFFPPADPVVQIVTDSSRQILYSRSNGNTITVSHTPALKPGDFISALTNSLRHSTFLNEAIKI